MVGQVHTLEEENRMLKESLEAARKQIASLSDVSWEDIPGSLPTEDLFDMITRDHMYRLLVENLSEGTVLLNHRRVIVYSNRQFADLTGYELKKVIGSDFASFLSEASARQFSRSLKNSDPQRSFFELSLLTREKGHLDILGSVNTFLAGGNEYHSILTIDISFQKKIMAILEHEVDERTRELAEANKRLTGTNRELSEVNNYLDNFVHAIAHDLRAPVANLKLVEEMLRVAPEEQKPELLTSIYDNIHRLDSTLKGLVRIIREQSSKEIETNGVDVVSIVEDVIEGMAKDIKAAKTTIRIEKKTDDKITYVEGYLRSIASNLISNALKYAMPGRHPRLEIVFDKTEKGYLLIFADNGSGIDLEKHGENLFRPFQRFSSETKGMGIGLHIIQNMVRKSGGRIEVESEPGRGTTFYIYLKDPAS